MARTSPTRLVTLAAAILLAACGSTRKDEDGAGGQHPAGYANGTAHGPEALADLGFCQSCHGADFAGTGTFAPSCNDCHASAGFANWASNCTFCHGPVKLATYTAADLPKSAPATGAHAKHVNGGPLTSPVACAECHVVPSSLAHVNGLAAVFFGPRANTGGLPAPSYTTPTCSNVYCHGKTLEGAATPNPAWNGPAMVCGSCHNLAPTSGLHTFHLQAPRSLTCGACHKGYADIDFVHHVNGTGEAVLTNNVVVPDWSTKTACTSCH